LRAAFRVAIEEVSKTAPRTDMYTPAERDAVRRALDDLEAAEARVQRDAKRVHDETRARLVGDILPVLDNPDRTLAASAESPDLALVEGVRMVRDHLEQVLLRYGVERVESVGERFDPALHHAIALRPVEVERRGRVVDEVTAGYALRGKVLRPAAVVVGAA